MRNRLLAASVFLLGVGLTVALAQGAPAPAAAAGRGQGAPAAPPLKLTTAAFADGGRIPDKYGCSAQPVNVSVPLQWSDVPAATVTLALMMHDLDPRPAKGFDDFLHWMVFNIPPASRELPEGVPASADLADGSKQLISAGRGGGPGIGYRSPCPPAGAPHHYVFELFALDTKLDVPASPTRADLVKAIDGHIIGHAVIVGLFSR
jgi:Raf kinase inhibitor-like YbhB/YbcL family protein